MTKKLLLAALLLASTAKAAVEPAFVQKMCNAIFLAEGGAKTRYPYGVMSVKVKDTDEARKVCATSVRNNWARWEKAGKPGEFIDFMADRWCPKAADPVGNVNWKRNVKAFMAR